MMRPSTNLHGLVIVEVEHPEPCVEGESAVGGGQLLHVVDLAIGGTAAVVRVAVPTGPTSLGLPQFGRGRRHRRRGRRPVVLLVPAAGQQDGRQRERQAGS
jgi:hypothetical protein